MSYGNLSFYPNNISKTVGININFPGTKDEPWT